MPTSGPPTATPTIASETATATQLPPTETVESTATPAPQVLSPIPVPTADTYSPPPASFTADETDQILLSLGVLLAGTVGGDASLVTSSALADLQAIAGLKEDAERQRKEPLAALAAVMGVAVLFAFVMGKP